MERLHSDTNLVGVYDHYIGTDTIICSKQMFKLILKQFAMYADSPHLNDLFLNLQWRLRYCLLMSTY